jgi:cell division protein FtsB
MVSHTRLKSFLTGLALYTMAAALIGYFGVNAYTGKYGLHAQAALDQEMIALTGELARLKQERIALEQRVSLLRAESLDPDMLDERARFQLEFAHPRDLVRVTAKRN